ncbi:MAG: PIN domain-containing protein [Terrimicrobiaceae bacterium]|jgi:predicted nucleic acid-binding protein|nr:PIN domain-containing protein [Terrimicrobiaceae bacterium]
MLSIDTNILLHGFNEDSPRNEAARAWLESIARDEDVAISEFILAEFYGLLRNSAVLKHPLPADEAVEVIQTYRRHPRWRLIGFPTESRPLHDTLWKRARAKDFAFRKLYDTRSVLTLTAQGVTEFATVNVKDFEGLGFRKVWNPITQ